MLCDEAELRVAAAISAVDIWAASFVTRVLFIRSRLKREPANARKTWPFDIVGITSMCAATSFTDHPPHSDGVSHCSGVNVVR